MDKTNELLNNYVDNSNALLQVFINKVLVLKNNEILELKKEIQLLKGKEDEHTKN